jgi:hypothetical protein
VHLLSVAMVFAGLVVLAGPAAAVDAPNSCRGTTANRSQGIWLHDTVASSADADWFRFTTTSTRYAYIELGNLTANAALTLYDSACRAIVTSDHSGARYEQLYRYLTAGRYYVRVTGVSGATTPYDLRFRSLTDRVFVVSARTTSRGGYLTTEGEILNNTRNYRELIEIDATYYNSAGRVVGTDFTYADLQIVPNRRRSPFSLFRAVPSGYDHLRLTVTSDVTTAKPVGQLTVTRGVPSTDELGDYIYPGEVHNGNAYPVEFTEVIGVEYGPRGNVLHTTFTFTNPDKIAAGAKAPFELDFPDSTGLQAVGFYVDADRA